MSRTRKHKKHSGGGLDTRTVLGLLVGLVGVAGAASVLLKSHPNMQPVKSTDGKNSGVDLKNEGTVTVGMASSIPNSVGIDTGAVDYTYNPAGWDYAPIGVAVKA